MRGKRHAGRHTRLSSQAKPLQIGTVHGPIVQAPRRAGNTSARTYSPAAQILQEASAARAYLPAGQLKQTAETSNSPSEQAEAAAATRRARQVVFLKNRRAGGRGQKHSPGGTCIGFEYWGAGLTAAEGDAAARRRAAAASSNTHMVELESNSNPPKSCVLGAQDLDSA
jgi:hypothetical protein